jgi:hypothetical protein
MFAGWLSRTTTSSESVADCCEASGAGLHAATARQFAVFNILAKDTEGTPVGRGGDSFNVSIRLVRGGEQVRARVIDNQDGSYTVGYKAVTSGKVRCAATLERWGGSSMHACCQRAEAAATRCATQTPPSHANATQYAIHVNLTSGAHTGPLPGSPFACDVSTLTPSVAQSRVHGKALTLAVAREQQVRVHERVREACERAYGLGGASPHSLRSGPVWRAAGRGACMRLLFRATNGAVPAA